MSIDYPQFSDNVDRVEARIEAACSDCGRSLDEVRLMAVTKTQGAQAIDFALRKGLISVGENRVQEAADKKPQAAVGACWELIGHLQSNKARLALATFDRIQSVDRVKLIHVLDRLCGELGLSEYPILLEVNAGNDPAKFGVSAENLPALLETALQAKSLRVDGLMTIAPFDEDLSVAARCFNSLRSLRDEMEQRFSLKLPELSMGMTGDLEEAIKAGSTCIRIGTALYGARNAKSA